jgi:hypothetical protein
MLDSREYELEFSDGSKARANANLIAENLYSMVNEQGKVHNIFKGIIDHRFPVKRMVSFEGETAARLFTKDGELQVQWVSDKTTWIPYGRLKRSNPIEVAEYVVANQIADESIIRHWARDTLWSQDRIIKKLKTRYQKRTHKHGV